MGSLEGSSLVFITFITPLQPDMPGSLLRMRSTASSQHTRTASCPLSHRPQYPHPQVHGSSPVGSEFCQVSPRAPPPQYPTLISPYWSAEESPFSPRRCCPGGCQNRSGVLALPRTSQGLESLLCLPSPTTTPTYGLERGSPRGTRAARVPARRRGP